MRPARLFGPLLLLAGGTLLAFPQNFELQTGLTLTTLESGFGSLTLMLLGLGLAVQNGRAGLVRASSHGWAALRHATGRSAGKGPAKRMKIRIRCAR